ncbi:uncharacterized protein LOC131597420 [Vicia villosa]|uniref:uncharacterized protein LOC131597420 n=1 Tax=Vicia villosa TaxID=3911 RepID=UPI00273ADE35|nr:uncharacterized protein LOC131597420 [Vicia villosa]
MDRARHDRMLRQASKLKGVVKKSAGPRLAAVQRSPVAGSGASSSSAADGSPLRASDQGESLRPITVLPAPLRPQPDPDALLLKEQGEELASVKARLSVKEDTLADVQGQYTLLSRTLYGAMMSSSVREASLRRSQAPVEDESEEERALLTRADLIQYIRVLGSDCVAAAEDTYNSTVTQLTLKNPGVELVTEGTEPYHRVEGDQIVSPVIGEEPATQEAEEVQMEECA